MFSTYEPAMCLKFSPKVLEAINKKMYVLGRLSKLKNVFQKHTDLVTLA